MLSASRIAPPSIGPIPCHARLIAARDDPLRLGHTRRIPLKARIPGLWTTIPKEGKSMSYQSLSGGIQLPKPSEGDRSTQVGSSHHFTGCVVLGRGPGRRVGTESHLERKAALIIDARRETRHLVEQKRFEWRDNAGQMRWHWIDLVQTCANGLKIGYAVRPIARASVDYLLKLAKIKEQAIFQGVLDDLRLFTEEDVCPIEWHNAKLFLAVRRPDAIADPIAAEVATGVSGVTTVDALVAKTGLEGMGYRAMVRLIRTGHLEMVRHELISRHAQVFRTKELLSPRPTSSSKGDFSSMPMASR